MEELYTVTDYLKENPEKQAAWMKQLEKADWDAGRSLCRRLKENDLTSKTGENTQLLLMIDKERDEIAAYCTLAEKDDIQPTDLTPWIGYVFTYPKYRGKGLARRLLEHAENLARQQGVIAIYISTGHEGLYERYGYSFAGEMKDIHDTMSRVYKKSL